VERDKALAMALGQIEKQHGKGSIMKMGEKGTMAIESIPTGSIALDVALGVGGLPRGRVTEIYGPESSGKSTLAMHVVAEAQRNGGICAYIDAEHAMDPVYAAAIGVDVDELLISQPDTGEQALEIADMLIRSGALDVVVIDSVAALTPRAEIEGEMGDSHVGLQARLMSQALRKLTANLNKSNTICIFINQLREKIGVMFGCFDYGTRVTLADGTQEKIGKIVNQKLPVEVLSYDPDLDAVVPKKVIDWFDNGRTEAFLRFTVAKPSGNGRSQFACTPNHLIRTPGGWREAQELAPGDRVLQTVSQRLSDLQWQVILGGLMGDGALSPGRSGHAARFRWGHGAAQVAYADWKAELFANIGTSRTTNAAGAVFHDLTPLPELGELHQAVYLGGRKVLSDDYLKGLTPLSLAIWYMDDGSFTLRAKGLQERTREGSGRSEICVQAFEPGSRQRLVRHLADTWGIRASLRSRGARGQAVLTFSKDETAKLHALIAPFVHPSMQYKLLPTYQGRFGVEPVFAEERQVLMPLPILDIEVTPPRGGQTHRFDIEVEGTHNYFVDGTMVHNSPETTPGGRALKFYSSVRIDIRRIESIKDGVEVVGNRTRTKVVKNKCVAAGTTVFDPVSGLTHRIEDIVEGEQATHVVAADKAGGLHIRPITQRFDQGEAEVIGLALRDGTTLWVTPDHKVMTDRGWLEAGELTTGDRLARPRSFLDFGDVEPVPVEHARLLGYLIGGGYVGGRTPVPFINTDTEYVDDVTRIAATLGCDVRRRGSGDEYAEKRIPSAFFAPEVSSEVVANLIFGLWTSDGYVTREQTGGIRIGFTTTSEQLAHQLHWLLLRWGIGSSVRRYDPSSKRPSLVDGRRVEGKQLVWEVRISGIDNVERYAEVVPMWGRKGQALTAALTEADTEVRRGSRRNDLPDSVTEPVLAYLRGRGVTPTDAAALVGPAAGDPQGGLEQVLGSSRLRRDRVQALADALDSAFLADVLAEEVWFDQIVEVAPAEWRPIYDIEVDEHHTFVANDIVVSNCAPPFKQAEFDIMYGKGISREGSVLDLGVDLGIVKKSGAWYTYEGEQLGQGRENAKAFLHDNPEIMVEISERVRTKVGIGVTDGEQAEGDDAVDLGDVMTEVDDEPITLDD
jgi:recombination protein RecA